MPKNCDRILKQTKYKKDLFFEHQRSSFTHVIPEEISFNRIDKSSQTNILSSEVDTLIRASCIFSTPNFPTRFHKAHLQDKQNRLVWSAQVFSYVLPSSDPIALIDSSTQTLISEGIDIFEDPSTFDTTSVPFYVINPNKQRIIDASLLAGAVQPFHIPPYYKVQPPQNNSFTITNPLDLHLHLDLPTYSYSEYRKFVITQKTQLPQPDDNTQLTPLVKKYRTDMVLIKPEIE